VSLSGADIGGSARRAHHAGIRIMIAVRIRVGFMRSRFPARDAVHVESGDAIVVHLAARCVQRFVLTTTGVPIVKFSAAPIRCRSNPR